MADVNGRDAENHYRRERVVRIFAALSFIVFFQVFMVAPMIPRLAMEFGVSKQFIGLIIPAYMVPYGVSTLFFGLLSDRFGRQRIMILSLSFFLLLTLLTATAQTAGQMLAWRFSAGLGASGIVPLAIACIGTMFPPEERGRPLGWLFGAMAGGMAFGSSLGVLLRPYTGWRLLFVGIALCALPLLLTLPRYGCFLDSTAKVGISIRETFREYRNLLSTARGARTFSMVLVNSLFHSGVYTWLGVYLVERYHLSEVGIGLALLGYGVPGFLFGPFIGRAADRWGRRWMIPFGLLVAALSVSAFLSHPPLVAAGLAIATLSLGYDMTQPMLAGIVTHLNTKRPGQAMGLNVFLLFVGFGLGSLIFGAIAAHGFDKALLCFAAVQSFMAFAAVVLFRNERVMRPRAQMIKS
jgi:predicted MFS family arabinose efflux permease